MQVLNVIPFKVVLDNLKTSDQNIIKKILNFGLVDAFGFFEYDAENFKWCTNLIPEYKFDATELGLADNFFEYDGIDGMLGFFDTPVYKIKRGFNLKRDNISSSLRSYDILLDSYLENNNRFLIDIGSRFYNIQYKKIEGEIQYSFNATNGQIDTVVKNKEFYVLGALPLRYVGDLKEHKFLSNLLGFLGNVNIESQQVFYYNPEFEETCSIPLSSVILDNVSYNFYTPTGQLLDSVVLFAYGVVKGITEKGELLTVPLNQLHYIRKFNDKPITGTIVKHYQQGRNIEILNYGDSSIVFLDKNNGCKYEYRHGFYIDGINKYNPASSLPEYKSSFVYIGQYDDEYDEFLYLSDLNNTPSPEPVSFGLNQELLNKDVVKKVIGDAKKLTQCKTHEVFALKSLPPLITEGQYYYKETRNSIRDDQGYSFTTRDRIFKEVAYE